MCVHENLTKNVLCDFFRCMIPWSHFKRSLLICKEDLLHAEYLKALHSDNEMSSLWGDCNWSPSGVSQLVLRNFFISIQSIYRVLLIIQTLHHKQGWKLQSSVYDLAFSTFHYSSILQAYLIFASLFFSDDDSHPKFQRLVAVFSTTLDCKAIDRFFRLLTTTWGSVL